jgi:hypothetical protein
MYSKQRTPLVCGRYRLKSKQGIMLFWLSKRYITVCCVHPIPVFSFARALTVAMPKGNVSSSLMRKWIEGKPEFSCDGAIIYCKACETKVVCSKKFQLDQHAGTVGHEANVLKKKPKQQQLIINTVSTSDSQTTLLDKRRQFNMDLCESLLSANIPFWKLKNQKLHDFLTRYTEMPIPDESTLRKNYLPMCYEKTLCDSMLVSAKCGFRSTKQRTPAVGTWFLEGSMENLRGAF